MNVRVRPSVHCTYAPEEHALRLVLTEASSETLTTEDSKPETSVKQEVVVYAMKVGCHGQLLRRDTNVFFFNLFSLEGHAQNKISKSLLKHFWSVRISKRLRRQLIIRKEYHSCQYVTMDPNFDAKGMQVNLRSKWKLAASR